mmetsp:Transcript_45150/g.73226  ORF Transcript_45150/g.73226 Transcript_45150/m.73226 type:complete len:207 (+) Transcript_45150:629-1249(+)
MLQLLQHLPAHLLCLWSCSTHGCPIRFHLHSLWELLESCCHEGQAAREQEEEHAAHRPHVTALAEVALPNLRCHVRGRPRHDVTPVCGRWENLRQAKVHDHHVHVLHWRVLCCRKHHIFWFQILVNHSLRMAVGYRRQRMLHHLGNPKLVRSGVHRLKVLDVLCEIATSTLLHDEIEVVLVLKILEDSEDVRVVELLENCELFASL